MLTEQATWILKIVSGDYLFTFQNLFNKKFYIEKGGTITFNGSPYNALLDIKTIYSLEAPLYDLLLDSAYKQPVPVECVLLIRGTMSQPTISFDINLPKSSEQTITLVKSNIPSDEEMTRQFLSLLLLNKFTTPTHLATGVVERKLSGGTSAPMEALSNQISNWLSSMSKNFSIGLNYRPGDEITADKLDIALKTRLFNDRLIIKTNLGITGQNQQVQQQNQTASSSVIGDIDIEYLLTESGNLKAIFFSHSPAGEQNSSVQGIGVAHTTSFSSFSQLFKRKKSKKSRTEQNREQKSTTPAPAGK